MRSVTRPFWFVLAVLFLVEAWLWDRLHPLIAALVSWLPFDRAKAAVARAVAKLPPLLTLAVFIIPALVILPFKLAAVWLLARGQVVLGVLMFVAAKTAGLAVTAFLFEVCKPKLMQLSWFVRFYGWMIRLKDWAHARTEPARRYLSALRLRVLGESGGFARRIALLRARASRPRQPLRPAGE